MVEKEIQYFCVAMGHENESFEDFVKSHDAYQEYLMFFPMNNGLASVAGNVDKLSSLQKRV
jgi:pre-mRNA-splicing factor CDC5/CEF1